MDRIKVFVFALCALFFSVSASAATVTVISSESIGYTDAYWAGIVVLDVNGQKMIGMFDSLDLAIDRDLQSITSWEANLYTQADILGGATVNFSPERYSNTAPFFLNGLLGYNPPDPLWAAGLNEMVWNTMIANTSATPTWYYATLPYDGQLTLMDVYNTISPTLDPSYNYSDFMMVLANAYDPITGTWPNREMLVYAVPMGSTPIPPAVWLFGSGLLGLIAVTRSRSTK